MAMITIRNECLTVQIDCLGAEMKSVKKGDTEFMWCADPKVWAGTAPVLFPICGRLKDGKYMYQGKEYQLPIHGFAKTTEFEVEKQTDSEVVFFMCSSPETRQVYPFEFEFRISYLLTGAMLNISYMIKNCSDEAMYCSVGSHEAYACPEGIEEYSVVFEKEEEMNIFAYQNDELTSDKVRLAAPSGELPLTEELFRVDSLVFEGLHSSKATLLHRNSGKQITVFFPDQPYFIIWHKPGGNYICLEPWCGMGALKGSNYELTEKTGIMKVEKEKTVVHQILFEESKKD